MVDDEPRGRAEALRTVMVAVPGHDEQLRAVCRVHDLAFDPAGSFQAGTGAVEAPGGGVEQGTGRGHLLQLGAWVTATAPEQSGEGAAPASTASNRTTGSTQSILISRASNQVTSHVNSSVCGSGRL
jgi:hypothetical protein